MTGSELATRLAAWTWAAETLGQPAPVERMRGLVEVTMSVKAERLKACIQMALESSEGGFLPSPGAVIAQSKKLAERDYAARSQRTVEGRIQQARIESGERMTTEEREAHVQSIRDKIKRLADSKRFPGGNPESNVQVHGWRPKGAISETGSDGSAGLAAVKADLAARGEG